MFPTSGRAEILGRPVGDVAIRRRIGYLPENPYFYDHLTAVEAARLLRPAVRPRRRARGPSACRALLDQVGLGAERRLPLRRYSKGMLQRVGLAQALLNEPDVVFLDEPMSGLDPIGRRMVRELILRLATAAPRSSSARTSCRTPRRCAAAWRILAGGRLAAAGRLTDMLAFDVKGWEIVVDRVGADALPRVQALHAKVTRIADARYAIELPADARPERDPRRPRRRRRGDRRGEPAARHARGLLHAPGGRARPPALDAGVTTMVLPAIALNVFRESVRDHVFYNLLLFAVLLVGASVLVGQMTAGQDVKIIKDLGLAATSLFGLFIAVFVGHRPRVEGSRAAQRLQPARRSRCGGPSWCSASTSGLALTLLVNVAVMAVVLYLLLAYMHWTAPPNLRAAWEAPAVDPALLKAFLLIYVQLLLVTAIALFFSTFSSPMLSAVLTFGLYVIGHFNADLKHFDAIVTSAPLVWLLRALYYLLPNLAPFDVTAQVVHGQPVAGRLRADDDRLRGRLRRVPADRGVAASSRGGT